MGFRIWQGARPSLIIVDYKQLVGLVLGEEPPAANEVVMLVGRQCVGPHT